ncbi:MULTISPECIES: hypothetical protein [Burkholderia]|uniref:CDP-6-deoxy-delta-3,4-glucoseen reductase n=1 Tax=Burkholderia aenigmatica TaxID=2015348 RepID=A0ABY6XMD7_9BURK|nr:MULTISPECIES: hypothetical protein [Burkholderia]VWC56629.1 CDP-6-deoxy-delta-3,4-glucoseen reductase [Burkholderia aenigmatica]VWC80463.1 CDP-6-deoxy-delta-3,4-glucoseen reductase [Burkholderia aenigmatica]
MSAHRRQKHGDIQSLALLCCSKALCDLEIGVREIAGADGGETAAWCRLPTNFDDALAMTIALPFDESADRPRDDADAAAYARTFGRTVLETAVAPAPSLRP